MKKLNKRNCLNCGERFQKKRPLDSVCSVKCAIERSKILEANKTAKNERKEQTKAKEAMMTHGDYIQLFQRVFNVYIKARDKNDPCISCGTTKNVRYDAGHYWAAGNYGGLRFNENNANRQCSHNCNNFLSGNQVEYRIRLIVKIGEKAVQKLDNDRHILLDISIPEIKEQIQYYREKTKILKMLAN